MNCGRCHGSGRLQEGVCLVCFGSGTLSSPQENRQVTLKFTVDPPGYFDYGMVVKPYLRVDYHADDTGYIVWRRATGDNVELLHLKVSQKRQGHGTALLRVMLQRLLQRPPYATVFAFCLLDRPDGHAFYRAVGFKDVTEVSGVYKVGNAFLFSANYVDLVELHNVKVSER